jgi:hypothetical protein
MRKLALTLSGLLIVTLSCLLGCQSQQPSLTNAPEFTPITDQAKIVSINQTLGMGSMQLRGETINFWWQNNIRRAAEGPAVLSNSLETSTIPILFNAAPGDTIVFRGFITRGEIYITTASTLKAK